MRRAKIRSFQSELSEKAYRSEKKRKDQSWGVGIHTLNEEKRKKKSVEFADCFLLAAIDRIIFECVFVESVY